MAAKTYQVVLTGKPLEGRTREAAAAALARILRMHETRALELLGGRDTVVKRDLDEAEAKRLTETLRAAGCQARLDEVEPAVELVTCPACRVSQPKSTQCRRCGTPML